MSANRYFAVFVLACIGCIITLRLFVLVEEMPVHHDKLTAVVYASHTFHEEVTASMTCMLHDMGYHVVAYIENGVSVAGFVVPFSQKRIFKSRAMYGHCVNEWVTINSNMKIIDNPAVLMYVTSPMTSGTSKDYYSFDLLNRMSRKNTKLMLVTHHVEQFWQQIKEISKYIKPEDTTFLFLAEHVRDTAQKELSQHPELPALNLDYVFPVLNLKGMVGSHAMYLANQEWKLTPDVVTYSIQGNFGGRHKKRKDLNGTIACLNGLGSDSKKVEFIDLVRADYHTNLRGGVGALEEGDAQGEAGTLTAPELQLHLVGHAEGPLTKEYKATHFSIRSFSDLTTPEFYTRLTKSKFLISALGSPKYLHSQATSSVPAALVAHVPLVTTAAFLQLYPCLRDLPVHRRISGQTECESIRNAYSLTDADYESARLEMQHCQDELWQDGMARMKTILSK